MRHCVAVITVATLGCRGVAIAEPTSSAEDEYAVIRAVACDPAHTLWVVNQGQWVLDTVRPPGEFKDASRLTAALSQLMKATDARPALAADTLADFMSKGRADTLPLGPGLGACKKVFLSETDMKSAVSGVGPVLTYSRVGFSRSGNQALVLVGSRRLTPGGRGDSEWLFFLTKPAGQWVVVGWAPWSVV